MPEDSVTEPLQVAIAVIEQSGRYLISQRLEGDSFGGYWEFPGGKLKPGERLEDCVAREIQEELGLEIAVGAKRMAILHEYPEQKIQLQIFDCQLCSGEPQAIECADFRWVEPEALTAYQFPPASSALIASLQQAS